MLLLFFTYIYLNTTGMSCLKKKVTIVCYMDVYKLNIYIYIYTQTKTQQLF